MPSQPPPPGDVDMLALAVQAVDDHPPGLHPVDVIAGARQGFTVEQGQALLDDTGLLMLLTRQWRSRPPAPALLAMAHRADARGQTHLRLLEHTGQLVRLRSRSQYRLAAGTSSEGPEVLVDDSTSERGTVVTRRIFNDQGLLDVVIESDLDAVGSFPVVALYALSEDEPPAGRLLFLLVPHESGDQRTSHAEARLSVDTTLTSDRLSLFSFPLQAAELPDSLLDLVSHSVAVAKLPWKEAWRRAALSTPDGHPLRAAVLAGLTART